MICTLPQRNCHVNGTTFQRNTIKPGTWDNGTQNTDGTPEHLRNNGKLVEQSKYHRIAEQENTNNKTTPRDTTN